MKRLAIFPGFLAFVMGCAPYSQLKPKPELSPAEQGYVELKRGDKDLELKKNKKYFVVFPAPQEDNFYLVLSVPAKRKIKSSFTASLVDKKRPGDLIPDESPMPDTICAFPVGKASPSYYWLIENGSEDLVLKLRYRYAPQWRYKFETKHAYYQETLQKNIVDRTVYSTLGTSFHFDKFDFARVLDTVGKHTSALDTIYQEFLAIERIFPSSIVNSTDKAYLDYRKLKGDLEEELAFQKNYLSVLAFFQVDATTKGSPLAYLGEVEKLTAFFVKKDGYAPNVLAESRAALEKRMNEVPAAYDDLLSTKSDAGRFAADFRLDALRKLGNLYQAAGVTMPERVTNAAGFITDYDAKVSAVAELKDSSAKLESFIKSQPAFPPDDLFRGAAAQAGALEKKVPEAIDQKYGTYRNLKCSEALNEQIAALGDEVTKRASGYREAEALVPQLNAIKAQKDYRSMLGVLRQKPHLTFLLDKYRDLDRMSVEQQGETVRASLNGSRWPEAERGLQELFSDDNYLDLPKILATKEATVRDLEDSLYWRIERVTRSRVNQFCDEKVNQLENVDSLYEDSVFLPVYDVKFSSGSKRELLQRKEQLIADLAKLKENEFPARAVKLLYDQFLKNPDDNGVLKARAIVTHGKRYKGADKDIQRRVAECDPNSAKWITKATDYRRVFALPVTTKRKGTNKYVVRLDIRVPTEAQFPVYDVNIKLPKDVADNAASSQWYDEISINKQLLKNEGRFSIGAPTASNSYECQITPVQVNKDKSNILEITFNHDSFKAHNISVMVQKPIIKKN